MTATIGAVDFAWVNALRQEHYPPEKNQLSAHVTLFHHLPPQALDEIIELVKQTTLNHAYPRCDLTDVIQFEEGAAYKLYSPKLLEIREFFAEAFHGLLIQQDQQKPRFHITVQNKASTEESKKLFQKLNSEFEPRPFEITGIALHYYLNGPWEEIGSWRFRGKS